MIENCFEFILTKLYQLYNWKIIQKQSQSYKLFPPEIDSIPIQQESTTDTVSLETNSCNSNHLSSPSQKGGTRIVRTTSPEKHWAAVKHHQTTTSSLPPASYSHILRSSNSSSNLQDRTATPTHPLYKSRSNNNSPVSPKQPQQNGTSPTSTSSIPMKVYNLKSASNRVEEISIVCLKATLEPLVYELSLIFSNNNETITSTTSTATNSTTFIEFFKLAKYNKCITSYSNNYNVLAISISGHKWTGTKESDLSGIQRWILCLLENDVRWIATKSCPVPIY